MGTKNYTHAWIKGRRKYEASRGTKCASARQLLYDEYVHLSKKNLDELGILIQAEVMDVSALRCARVLESKGWQWTRLSDGFVEKWNRKIK